MQSTRCWTSMPARSNRPQPSGPASVPTLWLAWARCVASSSSCSTSIVCWIWTTYRHCPRPVQQQLLRKWAEAPSYLPLRSYALEYHTTSLVGCSVHHGGGGQSGAARPCCGPVSPTGHRDDLRGL